MRSSSALTSYAPLKACPCHPRALVMRLRFYLYPIGKCSIHHQIIASVVALIMPYRPLEVVEWLLWCLYKLLQHMTIIRGMFSCYLTYSAPQCRPCTWSYLSFQPQRHQSSSCHIVRNDQEMVLVMPLTLAFQAPYFFAHLWSNCSVLL